MKNWTIGKRITAGGGILCALLVAVGGITWQSLGGIRENANFINGDVMPGLIQSGTIYATLAENFGNTLRYGQAKTAEERNRVKAVMADVSKSTKEAVEAYGKSITRTEDRQLFEAFMTKREASHIVRTEYLKLVDDGKADEAIACFETKLAPGYKDYLAAGKALFEFNARSGEEAATAIGHNARSTTTIVITITLAALALGLGLGLVIIRGTNRALNAITVQLSAGADQTAAAASQVSTSSQTLAEGASEQAASLEETSASLEEISSMTKRNAESASLAKDLANQTRQAAELGAGSMAEMKQAMDGIKESSANIAKIVRTIDEIAFQTNILALNAAVEAARAGEAGAGFAVVADEVRSLAQRSAQSAKETATRIEDSVTRSEHGVQISVKVAQSFDEIVAKARKVDELVAEIATASGEQNQGIGQVTTAVSQMDKVTQSNAASAEESAAASEELSAQAEVMRESVCSLQQLVGGSGQPKSDSPAVARTALKRAPAVKHSPAPVTPVVTRNGNSLAHSHPRTNGATPIVPANGNGNHDEFFK